MSSSVPTLPYNSGKAPCGSCAESPLRSLHPSSVHYGLLLDLQDLCNNVVQGPQLPQVHHTADKVKRNEQNAFEASSTIYTAADQLAFPVHDQKQLFYSIIINSHDHKWQLLLTVLLGNLMISNSILSFIQVQKFQL